MSGPNGMLYGGDEIGALVFDPGHHSIRVGYAQEDIPKADIPSVVGTRIPEIEEKMDNNIQQQAPQYSVDLSSLVVPRAGMEISNYMKDGQIENWDLFEKVLDYCYSKIIKSPSEHHPALFTESSWSLRTNREKLTELLFEKYSAPAFFIVKSPVLAAFANGKSTALVVDAGASHTSAVPVVDGYALTASAVKSPLGGDHLVTQAKALLTSLNIPIVPTYTVASKEVIREREKPRYVAKKLPEGLTQSWQDWMFRRQLEDFCHSVAHISETPYDERTAAAIPSVHYEFSGGYHQDFGPERFKLAECLFDHHVMGASAIVPASIGMCDADSRPGLWGCVVVAGGGSLPVGWPERLTRDLQGRSPSGVRLRTVASTTPHERRFTAWIGGSILASIGTFQQMWISSQEYDESGKGQVERKCP